MKFPIFKQALISDDLESQLIRQHESEIGELLPLLGPLFGLGVLLFTVWDYWIDAALAPYTFLTRFILVLIGSTAYWPTRLHWSPIRRFGFIYFTHAAALIICEFWLKDGFHFGLAGISAFVFTLSVTTLRFKTFILTVLPPAILFLVLTYIKFPQHDFVFFNALALYFFSICLAYVIMRVIRFQRQKAFVLEQELIHITQHDSLTGIYNRRYLTELAEREIALARRHKRPLAIAMLDIDFFKTINDTYGHDIGDAVIKTVASTCAVNLRNIDHIGRIGGEEFVCILPETPTAEAMACAERLRKNIEVVQQQTPKEIIQFTVSIGVAVLDPSHADWKAFLKDADTALYQAKRAGRNRVVLANAAAPG